MWLADDPLLRRRVAVKVPRAAAWWDEHVLDEARALARVSHPAIVAVLDAGWEGSVPFIVLEHVDGGTLERLLAAGPMGPSDAVAVLRPAADALDHAHDLGVLHGDLKPENLLVPRRTPGAAAPAVKVADLGLAALADRLRGRAPLGDPRYAAPEAWRGSASRASDVFSLAAVLFHAVAGRPPLDGGSPQEIVARAAGPDRARLQEVRPDLPRALDAALASGLASRPAARPRTARELLDRVAGALEIDEDRVRAVEEARRRIARVAPAPAAAPRSCPSCGRPMHARGERCLRCGEPL